MHYLPLARKYRPKFFSDVVAQEAIIKGLAHALTKKSISPAYLLTGTRGIGKTTIARLIAMALNCEQGITSEPCNQCSHCLSIVAGSNPDVYEVDGASKTKVEDIRTLLENTQYMPLSSRYKVYIIDEVHMLSTHAFNALLKTLEEPYPHIVFVLATTDLEKIPMTVRSRCMHYALLPFSPQAILKRCQYILTMENIPYDDALLRVAIAGRGSMRDALTLLEQIIQIGHGSALETHINQLLPLISNQQWDKWLEDLMNSDHNRMQQALVDMQTTQPSPKDFFEKLLQHWFNCSLDKLEQTQSSALYSRLYEITLSSFKMLPISPDPNMHLQMTWLKLWHSIHHDPRKITVNINHMNSAPTPNQKKLASDPTEPHHSHKAQEATSNTTELPKTKTTQPEPIATSMSTFNKAEDFHTWLASTSLPKGLTGEALKYLKATRLQTNHAVPLLTLSYPQSHEALYHASALKKLTNWLKEHLPQLAIEITPSPDVLEQTKPHIATEQAIKKHPDDTLSPDEKKMLSVLGYPGTTK